MKQEHVCESLKAGIKSLKVEWFSTVLMLLCVNVEELPRKIDEKPEVGVSIRGTFIFIYMREIWITEGCA